MQGGEIYDKKIPSMKLTDLALAISKDAKQEIIGIRPGEKLHEEMVGLADAIYTYEYKDHYKILPSIYSWHTDPKRIADGVKVDENFTYCSDQNNDWMSVDTLQKWIKENKNLIGKI